MTVNKAVYTFSCQLLKELLPLIEVLLQYQHFLILIVSVETFKCLSLFLSVIASLFKQFELLSFVLF